MLSMTSAPVLAEENSDVASPITVDATQPSSANSEEYVESSQDKTDESSQHDLIASTDVPTSNQATDQTGSVNNKVADTNSKDDSEDEIEVTVEDYEKNVENFKPITIEDVYNAFTADGKEHVIYLRRPTCYYCRQFSPTLKEFNEKIEGHLEYYNTDGSDFDEAAKKFLFETVGVPGTPTLLRLSNGQPMTAWVGGGLDAQELYNHIYPEKTPESPKTDTQTQDLATPQTDAQKQNLDNSNNIPQTPDLSSSKSENKQLNQTSQPNGLKTLSTDGNRSQQDSLNQTNQKAPLVIALDDKVDTFNESKGSGLKVRSINLDSPESKRALTYSSLNNNSSSQLPKTGQNKSILTTLGLLLFSSIILVFKRRKAK